MAKYLYYNSGNSYDQYRDLKIDKAILGTSQTGTCTPFMIKMFMTVNGKILQCEKINHEFALGQVYEDRVELDLQYAADKQNGYLNKLGKQCAVCARGKKCPLCIYQIDHLGEQGVRCHGFTNTFHDTEGKRTMDFLRDNPHLYKRIVEEVTIK